jgi:hypothetical protein
MFILVAGGIEGRGDTLFLLATDVGVYVLKLPPTIVDKGC